MTWARVRVSALAEMCQQCQEFSLTRNLEWVGLCLAKFNRWCSAIGSPMTRHPLRRPPRFGNREDGSTELGQCCCTARLALEQGSFFDAWAF
eukprot:4953201-Amphidinium_carterae.1